MFDNKKAEPYVPGKNERIGRRIKEIMELRGMKVEDLARKMGLSTDRIRQYINGKRGAGNYISKFAEVLGVDPLVFSIPDLADEISVMYVLFEIDRRFALTAVSGNKGNWSFRFKNQQLMQLCNDWANREKEINELTGKDAKTETDKIMKKKELIEWKWGFGKYARENQTRQQIEEYQKQIEWHQERVDALESLINAEQKKDNNNKP